MAPAHASDCKPPPTLSLSLSLAPCELSLSFCLLSSALSLSSPLSALSLFLRSFVSRLSPRDCSLTCLEFSDEQVATDAMLLGPLQMHQPGLFGHPGLEADSAEAHQLFAASSAAAVAAAAAVATVSSPYTAAYRCIKQEECDLISSRTCDSTHSSTSACSTDSVSISPSISGVSSSLFHNSNNSNHNHHNNSHKSTRVSYPASSYESNFLTSLSHTHTSNPAMYSMKVPDGPSPAFRLTSSLSQKAALVWPATADPSSVHGKSASVTSLTSAGHPLGASLANPNGPVPGRPVSPSPGLAHWMSMIDHSHGHMPAPAHTGPAHHHHHHPSEQLHYSMWNGALDVSILTLSICSSLPHPHPHPRTHLALVTLFASSSSQSFTRVCKASINIAFISSPLLSG